MFVIPDAEPSLMSCTLMSLTVLLTAALRLIRSLMPVIVVPPGMEKLKLLPIKLPDNPPLPIDLVANAPSAAKVLSEFVQLEPVLIVGDET